MAKKKKTNKNLELVVRILQNGTPVADFLAPLSKNRRVDITADYKGDLSLPFYPIQSDLPVLKIVSNKVHLNIDSSWAGYFTAQGEFRVLDEHKDADNELELVEGDYGSLYTRDLRVMFRIEKASEGVSDAKSKKAYKGKLGPLLFHDKYEKLSLLAASLAAAVFIASFVGGLSIRKPDQPKVFDDLSEAYRMPFVSPNHILTAPEALQENIDRSDYIGSAVSYYRAWTKLIMGYSQENTPYIFPSTRTRYAKLRKEMKLEEQRKILDQKEANKRTLSHQGTAVMHIPAVVGNSLNMELVNLIDKIELMHDAFEKNLQRRRRVTVDYKEDDKIQVRNYRAFGLNSGRENLLRGVRVTKAPRNEQEMYLRAQILAKTAEIKQEKLYSDRAGSEKLTRQSLEFVELPFGVEWVSFVGEDTLYSPNQKIDQISAKRYTRKVKKKKIREPLIGEINPQLIRESVEKYAFQLRLCYELALRRDGALGGDMQVRWIVSSRGKVEDVELVGTSINDKNMAACVKRKIAGWKFPRPRRGSVEVTHSFNFTPRKG